MDLLMLIVNASLSGVFESIEQANSARLCRNLLVQVQDGLTLARFGEQAYHVDPGSNEVEIGDFGSCHEGKCPPFVDDVFRNVNCLPLRVVSNGRFPFSHQCQGREEDVPRADIPPLASLLGPKPRAQRPSWMRNVAIASNSVLPVEFDRSLWYLAMKPVAERCSCIVQS
jgi:hypothetical protein